MRSLARLLPLSLLLVAAACAAPDASDDQSAASAQTAGDPRAALAKDAKAVTLSKDRKDTTVAAPKKIASVLKALEGAAEPASGAPRCPSRFTLEILGEGGTSIAELRSCAVGQGALKVGTDWYLVPVAEGAVLAAFDGEQAIGDLLWGATSMKTPDGDGAGAQDLELWKKGFDLDAVPTETPSEPLPRCPPMMTFDFLKGTEKLASIALQCPKNENDTKTLASITAGGKTRWSTFDIARVFSGGF